MVEGSHGPPRLGRTNSLRASRLFRHRHSFRSFPNNPPNRISHPDSLSLDLRLDQLRRISKRPEDAQELKRQSGVRVSGSTSSLAAALATVSACSSPSERIDPDRMHHLCKPCKIGDLRKVEFQIVRRWMVLPILTIISVRIVWSDRRKGLPVLPVFLILTRNVRPRA